MSRPLVQWLGLALLLGLGFWFSRVRSDGFTRETYTVDTDGAGTFGWAAVIPKSGPACPVVIYAHGAGGDLAQDQPVLDQLAALGLAVFSLDYNQTNHTEFHRELEAVLNYVDRQDRLNTNAMVWLGLSLGANHFIREAERYPNRRPQILALLSSQGLAAMATSTPLTDFPGQVLLLQGEADHWFAWTNAEHLFQVLALAGVRATIKVFPGLGHDLQPDRGVIVRTLGEYFLTQLTGTNWWRNYHPPTDPSAPPYRWLAWLPAAVWLAGWRLGRRGAGSAAGEPATVKPHRPLTPGWRWLARALAAWVLAVYFIYVVTPHLPVGTGTEAIARRWLVPAEERADFEFLAHQPGWTGKPLGALFDQIKWAGYVRRRFELRENEEIYREFCLSPFITGQPGEPVNWRQTLWTEFEPGLGNESDPVAAARRVVRQLREEVGVLDAAGLPEEVATIWQKRVTDARGFETIYVAALRSVGIPARLGANQLAELWDGSGWQTAPGPALMEW